MSKRTEISQLLLKLHEDLYEIKGQPDSRNTQWKATIETTLINLLELLAND